MLVNMKEILEDAIANHYAVVSVNCPNFETAAAVVRAAERLQVPAILNHAEGHEDTIALEDIAPVLISLAERARVPIAVHIDHGLTRPFLMRAIRGGFTSIMYDCSMLSFEENMRKLKAFVDEVRPLGISVEAELGKMLYNIPHFKANDSFETIERIEDTFTDPIAAGEFAKVTGVDALTVSFGSMHGTYPAPPKLDINRLDQIRRACGCALVMHGASGIDGEQLRRSVRHGVAKVNYYTAMATAPQTAIENILRMRNDTPVLFHEISRIATEVMYQEILAVMDMLANPTVG